MARHTCRIAIRERPDIRLGPHIMDLVADSRRQSRHFAESHSPSRCRSGGIDDEDVHALDALAREVFGRVGGLVLFCCCAVGVVLVEGEEFGVFDDGEFVGGKGGKLKRGSVRDCVGEGVCQNRLRLTSVPRSIGLFMNAHAAKWVLASVRVKALCDVR